MKPGGKLIFGAAWIFYLAIVFEFLFMITPFALYFYSAYQPALALLNQSPYTAWLTAFFLPHFSQTDSSLIFWLNRAGWWLAYLGLALFLVSALQLYLSKLLRRGTVSGLLYRYVRHPQYLALAILGLGTTLIWPRFIVLIMYVLMLFIYRWLARFEERNCLQKYGSSYRRYLQETGMFLPRLGRFTPSPAKAGQSQTPVIKFASHALVLCFAVLSGFLLREISLDSVTALYMDEAAVVSPALMEKEKVAEIYSAARKGLDRRQLSLGDGAPLLVYVVPGNWYLPDLPIDPHEVVRQRGGHGTPRVSDPEHFKVLITRIRTHADRPVGKDILRRAHGFDPLLIAELEISSGVLTDIHEPPATVIWGDISPPLM